MKQQTEERVRSFNDFLTQGHRGFLIQEHMMPMKEMKTIIVSP
jgi:hypothetical protein